MPPGPDVARQTPSLPGELRIAAGHERRRFLVAHLDEPDLVLARAQRLHDPVDAVAWQPEYRVDAPVHQRLDEDVSARLRHVEILSVACRDARSPDAAVRWFSAHRACTRICTHRLQRSCERNTVPSQLGIISFHERIKAATQLPDHHVIAIEPAAFR